MTTQDQRLNILLSLRDRATGGLRRFAQGMRSTGVSARQLGREIAKADKDIDKFSERVGRVSGRVRDVGIAITALSAPFALLGKTSVSSFITFERAMNRAIAVTEGTQEEFIQLEELAKSLGKTTIFTAAQAAGALGFMGQAGLTASEQLEALPTVLNLAAAGQLDLARSADIVTNVIAGFGLEATNVAGAANVMTEAAISSNTNIEQMGQSFKLVAPIAKSAGLSFEEVTAAIGLLGDAGLQASIAGTSLRSAIVSLVDPSTGAAQAIEDMGVEVFRSPGKMRPLVAIIKDLEDANLNVTTAAEIFTTRGLSGILKLVSDGSVALQKFTTQLEDVGDTTTEVAEAMQEGLVGSSTRLTSAFNGLQVAIGESLEPALVPLFDAFVKVLNVVAILFDKVPGLGITFGVLTTVTLAAGGAMAFFGFIGPSVVRSFVAMRTAVQFLNFNLKLTSVHARLAALSIRTVLIASGIGIAIIAITTLAFMWDRVWSDMASTTRIFSQDISTTIKSMINLILDFAPLIGAALGFLVAGPGGAIGGAAAGVAIQGLAPRFDTGFNQVNPEGLSSTGQATLSRLSAKDRQGLQGLTPEGQRVFLENSGKIQALRESRGQTVEVNFNGGLVVLDNEASMKRLVRDINRAQRDNDRSTSFRSR